MNNPSKENSRQRWRLYLAFAVVAFLTVMLAVAVFAFRDPLLYNGTVTVKTLTDKTVYTQGENVTISTYFINGKDESFLQPASVSYKVLDSTGREVYSVGVFISRPIPFPTFPPHSKTLVWTHVWNQEVEAGNYTIKVSFDNGASMREIEIVAG